MHGSVPLLEVPVQQICQRRARWRRFVSSDPMRMAAYLVCWLLPNLLLIVTRSSGLFRRGVIDLDLLFAAALAIFLPRLWSPILLLTCFTFDLVEALAHTYYFGPQDLPAATAFVSNLPLSRLLLDAGLLLAAYLTLAILSWWLRRLAPVTLRWPIALILAAGAVTFSAIDFFCYDHHGHSGQTIDAISFHHLSRIPEWELFRRWQSANDLVRLSNSVSPRIAHSSSAASHGLALLSLSSVRPGPDIVEVIVESWGHDLSSSIDQQLLTNYNIPHITTRYRTYTGFVPFWGETIYGEARELCQSTMGFGILRASASILASCLPSQLQHLGYHTVAVHGFQGGMFYRNGWYPTIGFQERWFARRLHQQGLTECSGAFPGICDTQIASWLGNRLAANKSPGASPLFLYWITLNSHLPVPSSLDGLNPVSCAFDSQLSSQESLCAWFKLEHQVHHSIAALASRPDIPPTAFFIVGDHAPPFVSPDIRRRFSQTVVPYVLLIPRDEQPHPPSLRASLRR